MIWTHWSETPWQDGLVFLSLILTFPWQNLYSMEENWRAAMENHSSLPAHWIFLMEQEWWRKGYSMKVGTGVIAWLQSPSLDFCSPQSGRMGSSKSIRIHLPYYEAQGAESCHLAEPIRLTFLQNRAIPEKCVCQLPTFCQRPTQILMQQELMVGEQEPPPGCHHPLI